MDDNPSANQGPTQSTNPTVGEQPAVPQTGSSEVPSPKPIPQVPAQVPEPSKGQNKILIIAVILFVLSLIGAAGYYFLSTRNVNKEPVTLPPSTPVFTPTAYPTTTPLATSSATPTSSPTASPSVSPKVFSSATPKY